MFVGLVLLFRLLLAISPILGDNTFLELGIYQAAGQLVLTDSLEQKNLKEKCVIQLKPLSFRVAATWYIHHSNNELNQNFQ